MERNLKLAYRFFAPGAVSYADSFVILSPSAAPFKETPAISIVAQDLQTGDQWDIYQQSPSGFRIRFHNSGDAPITKTAGWIARGYGSSIWWARSGASRCRSTSWRGSRSARPRVERSMKGGAI
ncbi:hypothetical protein ACFP3O_29430 [Paraburkholderia silvatlantica]|uniref:LTD domain-containing protein n=1 Tax=Paraburkholderia silvatlantica TaxID=321895 RepID=A0ABR6FHM1_9BURK|nr:hypothetical protein [Paraburkholderia silvatlantica]MBB2926906.1 hypothetical protein [Paraburkholderia silvatlantica]